MVHRLIFSAAALGAQAQPGPCNHIDGDYPGCGISKVTHSSSKPRVGKAFLQKYFNVRVPGDECTDDVCDCAATATHPAWHIYQGRVYTTRQIAPGPGGPPPGNGFGLHLVDVPLHWTKGGLTTEEVEAHFTSKLGNMKKYDAFMDYNAVFATAALQSLKSKFYADGVKYLAGTWANSKGRQYTSIIVQVPESQLILELVQPVALTYEEDEAEPIQLEQRVPDSTLEAQEERWSRQEDAAGPFNPFIVSLALNRAISAEANSKIEDFYVTGMGATKTHDAEENGVSKKCFLHSGASVNICFTNRPVAATTPDFTVSDFENMLNTVHENVIGGHPYCPMDKWFDNHYAIDSQLQGQKIIRYVNTHKTYHVCSSTAFGSYTSIIFDPTGWGIQLDPSIALAADCYAGQPSNSSVPNPGPGKFNPACTTDTSNCGNLDIQV